MLKTFSVAMVASAAIAVDQHTDIRLSGLIEGFFIGAFDFHGMNDLTHCILIDNPAQLHFENAMRGFWNGAFQEVSVAVAQMGLAISDIGDMLDHCGKIDHHDYEQIQRMAEAFLHPKQVLMEAAENLIINGVNVYEDTREGLHDYRMANWIDAGEHFGQAAAMILYGKTQMVEHEELFYDFDNHWQQLVDLVDKEKDEKMHHFEAMKSSSVHFTFFRMGKIIEGLLAGSVETEVPHAAECLRDAKHTWERFGGFVDQFKHQTFNEVLRSSEDLGHIIHDLVNQLIECKAKLGTKLDTVNEMANLLIEPWYFIFHRDNDLVINGQDVHHEMIDAIAQWDNQHFYEFGHSIGLALSKITIGGQLANGLEMPKLNGTSSTRFQNDLANGTSSTRFQNDIANGTSSTRFNDLENGTSSTRFQNELENGTSSTRFLNELENGVSSTRFQNDLENGVSSTRFQNDLQNGVSSTRFQNYLPNGVSSTRFNGVSSTRFQNDLANGTSSTRFQNDLANGTSSTRFQNDLKNGTSSTRFQNYLPNGTSSTRFNGTSSTRFQNGTSSTRFQNGVDYDYMNYFLQ